MGEEPLFSVLIANYNNARYISQAIESVKNQIYKNWEIIIVDDCSTDNSLEVIGVFLKDIRIKLYHNLSNKGCGFTKARCAEKATGSIMGYLDPDDALTDDALTLMVEEHNRSPDVSLVSSSHFICSEKFEILREAYAAEAIPEKESYLSFGKGVTHFASFKARSYALTEGINENFIRAVDQDLYYKLEEVGKIKFINKPIYYYRIHDNGISTNKNLYKSRYWFVRAKKAAFLRRKQKPSVKNIEYSEVKAWESIYFMSRASNAIQNYNFCAFAYWVLKSLLKSPIDKFWSIKIKAIFVNTIIHKIIKKAHVSGK